MVLLKMASSSSTGPLSYAACTKTLNKLQSQFQILENTTPLSLCLQSIWNKLIDCNGSPSTDSITLQPLTTNCKKKFINCLESPIRYAQTSITPKQLLETFIKISLNNNWKVTDISLTGSGLPMSGKYWKTTFLQFPNMNSEFKIIFRKKLTPQKNWHNIDYLICIDIGSDKNVKGYIESAMLQSLLKLQSSNPKSNTDFVHSKGPTRIGEHCVVYSIGDQVKSLDITIWYHPTVLPELYTEQGRRLPILSYLTQPELNQPLTPVTIGISPEMLLLDSGIGIVRNQPSHTVGQEVNIGKFTRLMVKMTSGYLSMQEGFLNWALDIYLKNRKEPQDIALDARNNFNGHLPHSFGSFIAYKLHWLIAFNNHKEIQRVLANQLKFNSPKNPPTYLTQIYNFIINHPEHLHMLLAVLDFVMLLSYLKNPENRVTCGMWEGKLALRLCIDQKNSAFIQRRLSPNKCLKTTAESLQANEAVSAVLQSCIKEFSLNVNFTASRHALELLALSDSQKKRLNETLKQLDLPQISLPELEAPLPEVPEKTPTPPPEAPLEIELIEEDYTPQACSSSAIRPAPIVRINELILNKDWETVHERLVQATERKIPPNKLLTFGNHLWKLFEVWSEVWVSQRPSTSRRTSALNLLNHFAEALKMASNDKRSEMLYTLMQKYFSLAEHVKILVDYNQSIKTLLTDANFMQLLSESISRCFDTELLQKLHSLFPTRTRKHVVDQLSLDPLPGSEILAPCITFLREKEQGCWAHHEYFIALRMTSELRFDELDRHHFSVDRSEMFRSLYQHFKEKGDFTQIKLLLTHWKKYSSLPLVEQELELLEAGVDSQPLSDTIKGICGLWNNHQTTEATTRSLALGLNLATGPKIVPVESMGKLLSLFKDSRSNELIDSRSWRALLNKLLTDGFYNETWGIFQHLLEKKLLWDDFSFDIFIKLLNQNSKNANQARKTQLLGTLTLLKEQIISHTPSDLKKLNFNDLLELKSNNPEIIRTIEEIKTVLFPKKITPQMIPHRAPAKKIIAKKITLPKGQRRMGSHIYHYIATSLLCCMIYMVVKFIQNVNDGLEQNAVATSTSPAPGRFFLMKNDYGVYRCPADQGDLRACTFLRHI